MSSLLQGKYNCFQRAKKIKDDVSLLEGRLKSHGIRVAEEDILLVKWYLRTAIRKLGAKQRQENRRSRIV